MILSKNDIDLITDCLSIDLSILEDKTGIDSDILYDKINNIIHILNQVENGANYIKIV